MPRKRAALVGCGFFADNHLNAWRDLRDRCDLVAVCDLDPAKAKSASDRFGVPGAYTDIEEMLVAQKPDFLDVVTTAPSHLPIVRLCARHGIAAIVQKPLAPDWNDAVALVAEMDQAGLPLMVHENFRFQRPISAAIDRFRSGEIGRPTWGRFSWRTGFDVIAGQPYLAELNRFILLDLGIHVLDVARAFLGEVDQVFCRTQSIRPGIKGEDMATVMLGHRNGATSIVDITYSSRQSPDPFPQTLIHLEGTEGSLRLEDRYRLTVTSPAGTRTETIPPAPSSWGTEPWLLTQDSVVSTQAHWLDCLETGAIPATSGHDNLRTFALVEACYRSAETALPVEPASS
ncbi:Gfo/Idh/MocA family protein [Lichenicola sp.]|uniref:Gfo/Idh/MocA family protein n=1 Tax=Lichenicola sp. TaxID=2804529 RepID=UPI003AFF6F8D